MAFIICLEELNLGNTFIGINPGRHGRCFGYLQCDISLPPWLESGCINDDAVASVVDWPKHTVSTLRGMRKYSTVRARANEFGGDGSHLTSEIDHQFWVNMLRIVNCRESISKDYNFLSDPGIIP